MVRLRDLLNPNIIALLIKGLPGTGKTTLALELLRIYGKGIYISTRVSERKMKEQHSLVMKPAEEKEDQGRLEEIGFKDLRFGSGTEMLKLILNEVTKRKEFLIVLDTWDAIAKELEPNERLKIERSIVAMVEANEAKVVFVSEDPDLTTTDYLVDAIVTLKDEEFEGRRVRFIEWNKLRGLPISQKRHLFTLYEGRFTIFEKPMVGRPPKVKPKKFEPIKHPKDHYSSGSIELDAALGPFKPGSVLLAEMGKPITTEHYHPLLFSVSLNFVSQKGFTLILPSAILAPETIKNGFMQYFAKETIENAVRIGSYDEVPDPCFFKLDMSSIDDLFKVVCEQLEKLKNVGPGIYFVGVDLVEGIFNVDDTVKFFVKLSRRVRRSKDLLVMAAKHAVKSTEQLSDISDKHIKLDLLEGSLIGYTIKPAKPSISHIDFDYSSGFPRVKLTPMM